MVKASDPDEEPAERKRFMEAFGETQTESVARIKDLEAQLKDMRAKSKREEDQKKVYQKSARKKDEELKAIKD